MKDLHRPSGCRQTIVWLEGRLEAHGFVHEASVEEMTCRLFVNLSVCACLYVSVSARPPNFI